MAFDANSTPAPAEHPAVSRQRLYRHLSALTECLIAVMDDLDGDPDLEPSLSAAVPDLAPWGSQDAWLQGAVDDREGQCEDEGFDADGEPDTDDEASLCGVTFGAPFALPGLVPHDHEDACEDEGAEHDGREPEEYG